MYLGDTQEFTESYFLYEEDYKTRVWKALVRFWCVSVHSCWLQTHTHCWLVSYTMLAVRGNFFFLQKYLIFFFKNIIKAV